MNFGILDCSNLLDIQISLQNAFKFACSLGSIWIELLMSQTKVLKFRMGDAVKRGCLILVPSGRSSHSSRQSTVHIFAEQSTAQICMRSDSIRAVHAEINGIAAWQNPWVKFEQLDLSNCSIVVNSTKLHNQKVQKTSKTHSVQTKTNSVELFRANTGWCFGRNHNA